MLSWRKFKNLFSLAIAIAWAVPSLATNIASTDEFTTDFSKLNRAWWDEAWIQADTSAANESRELRMLLRALEQSPRGKALIETARAKNANFKSQISVGPNSVTETVFSRSYSLENGAEEIRMENFLKLSRNLSRRDALWDLSHELTHFVYREPPSPYTPSTSLAGFIRDGIEGKGGELEAFRAECEVSWDLEQKLNMPRHELCARYREKKGEQNIFRLELARRDYYRVGRYFRQMKKLGKVLPKINGDSIILSSSLEKAPYPVALVKEFIMVRRTACENNRRKQELISQQAARLREERAPASTESLHAEKDRLERFLQENCRSLLK